MAPKRQSSSRVEDNASFMHFLCVSATPGQKKLLIKSATSDQINAICECAFNILRQNVQLPDRILNVLRKPQNKKLIYQLADRKVSIPKKKKKLVNQVGGAFPLLALLAPIVGSLVGSLISG